MMSLERTIRKNNSEQENMKKNKSEKDNYEQ